MFFRLSTTGLLAAAIVISGLFSFGCSVKAANEPPPVKAPADVLISSAPKTAIDIQPNSPADTVRVFYQRLREKKVRDALVLTNLRPAIEGLTESELKDLQVDFDALAGQIPADIAINGEIIVENSATVTAKLPDNDTDEIKLQEIKLRRENGVWVILTVDEEAEAVVKKEGKNYFFALKIETHQEEAKAMLERIYKAQLVYSSVNADTYAEIPTLIENEFLPEDIRSTESTGYKFEIIVSADKKSYSAFAEPAVYGKTGKLSFVLNVDSNRKSSIKSDDSGGNRLKNK